MLPANFFPTGIVTGKAFCDREEERKLLKRRFQQNAHVVLISPRRYGKTSLITQFTMEQDTPFVSIDLLPATSGAFVRNAIFDGVVELLDHMMPSVKKAKEKILNLFANMNPVIELSALGQRLKLTPNEKTPQESIMKVLLNLDKAAAAVNQQLIFVMDEFQQIAKLPESHALEASIRHAVERSKNIFYIFSGSNRTLLEEMFKDDKRPLYHLCDEVYLERIKYKYYVEFLKKAVKSAWGKVDASEQIDAVLEYADCHPYYVNKLCRLVWDNDELPSADKIEKIWQAYVEEQTSDWVADTISNLTINQKELLIALADAPVKEVLGKAFLLRTKLSSSSVQRTLASLLTASLIYKNKEGFYCVLNPVMKAYLRSVKYLSD